mmetsp:Transcript_26182/g.62228  ORF Transcript_26182/g.62228 Transcript_26182/m.62228 type:complete len:278 (-) Transcript_26182:168-1001(-)
MRSLRLWTGLSHVNASTSSFSTSLRSATDFAPSSSQIRSQTSARSFCVNNSSREVSSSAFFAASAASGLSSTGARSLVSTEGTEPLGFSVSTAVRFRIQIRRRTQCVIDALAEYLFAAVQLKAYIHPSLSVPGSLAPEPVRICQSSTHFQPSGSMRSSFDESARSLPPPRLKLGSFGNKLPAPKPLKGTFLSYSMILSSVDKGPSPASRVYLFITLGFRLPMLKAAAPAIRPPTAKAPPTAPAASPGVTTKSSSSTTVTLPSAMPRATALEHFSLSR